MRKSNDATPTPNTFRILLIDDNRNGLLARKSVLTEQGYVVTACNLPEDAIKCFTHDCFDLVVTDYRMPQINGVQLILQLREIDAKVPIVLVSGMVDVLGLNEKNTGADAVIAKNSTEIQHMVRAVNRLLQRKITRKPVRAQSAGRSMRASNA